MKPSGLNAEALHRSAAREQWTLLGLAAPALLVIFLVIMIPVGWLFYLSFFGSDGQPTHGVIDGNQMALDAVVGFVDPFVVPGLLIHRNQREGLFEDPPPIHAFEVGIIVDEVTGYDRRDGAFPGGEQILYPTLDDVPRVSLTFEIVTYRIVHDVKIIRLVRVNAWA